MQWDREGVKKAAISTWHIKNKLSAWLATMQVRKWALFLSFGEFFWWAMWVVFKDNISQITFLKKLLFKWLILCLFPGAVGIILELGNEKH